MAERDFDPTRPHPGSGLMFQGPISALQAPHERAARQALEHVCEACGQFDASRGFKAPGRFSWLRRTHWSCTDPDCLSTVESKARERQEAA